MTSLNTKTQTIVIDSILGGTSPTSHYAGKNQFRASIGIDPSFPISSIDSTYSTTASGFIVPVGTRKLSNTPSATPLWIKPNPKNSLLYVYDARGSVYTIDEIITTLTALSDAGTTASLGNGCEYYDNYMYFATNTDITRYGPLNGSAGFVSNYWTGTLGKTALTNTSYPTTLRNNIQIPNHPLYRHSDGKLYIGDVQGNQGCLHYISTKKTTVEGDTDNVSTQNKITFGYGLYPTAIAGYGTDIAVSLTEVSGSSLRQTSSKIAFWDTVSASYNKMTWVEFPDSIITAMKNVNGVLYVVSGNYKTRGFRISRFIGGYSFQEVFYSEQGEPCLQGAIDSVLNRVSVGSYSSIPTDNGTVWSVGLQKDGLSNGVFNTFKVTDSGASTCVTAVCYGDATNINFYTPVVGYTQAGDGSTSANYGIEKYSSITPNVNSYWWSQVFRIGRPFKIISVRIPLSNPPNATTYILPTIYTDNGNSFYNGPTINITNYPNELNCLVNFNAAKGKNHFWLSLNFASSSTGVIPVELPIIIEYQLLGPNV